MHEIIFDTETTGLKPEDGERIIELGAVELFNRVPTGKTFHRFVNPEDRKVSAGAFDVHGISDEKLAGEKPFRDILPDWLEFIGDAKLVAHNAFFDVNFLNHEYARLDLPPLDPARIIDTLAIARKKHPMAPNSLDKLCERYGINNSKRDKHGALLDSELLAEVYIELLGGKQASLELASEAAPDSRRDKNAQSGTGGRKLQEKPVRKQNLSSRLSKEERDQHQAFVEKELGDEALWKRYL